MGTRDFGMGYAQGRRRRPLFRVWGYAPTREAVSVIFTLSFTRMCKVARAKGPGREWRDSRLRLPLTFTERATRSTWWRISRPITSRSSRCCRTGIKALYFLVGLCSPAGASRQTGIFRVRYIPFMVGGMGVCLKGWSRSRAFTPQSTPPPRAPVDARSVG